VNSQPARRFVNAFAVTVPALFAALVALAYLNYAQLPAPWISDSMAFNEKARWLNQHLARDSAPDVLVIGSSMGLNNLSGLAIQRELGVRSVVNASSWGLTADATSAILAELLRHVRPRLIILPVYHGDFRPGLPFAIEWGDFSRSLGRGREAWLYLHNPDVWDYLKSYEKKKELQAAGRASYYSLDFDATGGVPLACVDFHREEARWDYFKSESFQRSDISPATLANVHAMAELVRQRQIPFVVVVCPLRPEAERTFIPEIRAELWQQVRQAVESAGGIFILPPAGLALSDDDFADYCHLNACGADRFTVAWLRAARPQPAHP
jgi:hypothetical protein